jgi:hypothetical protein
VTVALPPRVAPAKPAAPPAPPTPPGDEPPAVRARMETLRSLLRRLRSTSPRDLAPVTTSASAPAGSAPTRPAATPPRPPVAAAPATSLDIPAAIRLRSVLSAEAASRFPAAERAELGAMGLDLARVPLAELAERVTAELTAAGSRARARRPVRTVTLISGVVQPVPTSARTTLAVASQPSVPQTVGTARPIGIGDLLVVRQQLVRYEPGEITFVENVLARERRERTHTRTTTTEQFADVETEQTREEERDTQSVERFELQREVSSVLHEEARLEAGATVAGTYGPSLEFSAETSGEVARSREEAAKTATNYSKEVTTKAATRVVDRRRERQSFRSVDRMVERNTHRFDNTEGTGNVRGLYQSLDKVLEAQVYSYGQRLLFDVTVPEPAALVLHGMFDSPAMSSIPEPVPFDVAVSDIDVDTYLAYVEEYGAVGVSPPPKPYLTVAKTFDGVVTKDEFGTTRTVELTLPDGYTALRANVQGSSAFLTADDETTWQIWVHVGSERFVLRHGGPFEHSLDLEGEAGSLGVAVRTGGVRLFVVDIEVLCQCSPELLDGWRLETFAALQEAHLRQQEEFDRAVEALKADNNEVFAERAPADNRRAVREELQRLAVTTLTGQQFELFGAIGVAPDGLPSLALDEADVEGRYARFFEQAFEWERMSYRLYPYFWGRRSTWLDRLALDAADPEYAAFLRAGSARVQVAVRPGFENAVFHYLDTGEIWDGGDPPTVTSSEYVALADEIAAATDRPADEVPVGEPWEVRLPTSLVALRETPDLPAWTRDQSGRWVSS